MRKNNDKKIIIAEIIIAAVLILAFAVVVVIDTFSTKASVELNVEQAQTVLDDTFADIPLDEGLAPGEWRYLNQEEIKILQEAPYRQKEKEVK